MSLINQVLKDLDKRGANTNIGEATIRVVHTHGHRNALLWVATGAVGMLAVGAAVWLGVQVSGTVQPKTAAVLPASLPVLSAASQPVAAPVQIFAPQINGISPERIVTSGEVQLISINGSHFREGARVSLQGSDGHVYENRPIISLTPTVIVLKLNLGRKTGRWQVEVLNADATSSGKYAFDVKVPQLIQGLAALPAREQSRSKINSVPEPAVSTDGVNKQPTQITLQQQAENEFRRSYQFMRQGQHTEALAGYENALKLYPGHEQARQTMVSLLLEKKRSAEAERELREGLENNPQQTEFAMLLARLQVERNAVQQALDTLLKTVPYADKKPEYQAFVAAMLQRQGKHHEAIDYFQRALQLKPRTGVWLMGLGISLRAEKRGEEARDVFKRALETRTLNAELQAFVEQQLKEI